MRIKNLLNVIAVVLIATLFGFLPIYGQGHYATGEFDTVKAEIAITQQDVKMMGLNYKPIIVVEGFVVREKYSYIGDPMPNGLPNNGGIYDDYFIEKKYLDRQKQEITENIWMVKQLGKNSK